MNIKDILFLIFASSISIVVHAQQEKKEHVEVMIFMHESCRICQYYAPTLRDLHESFESDSILFTGVFPNTFSEENERTNFKYKYEIPFPLVQDTMQEKTKHFGINITPEVIVYDHKSESILYKGRIDNSYVKVGERRRVVTSFELNAVLEKCSEGKRIAFEPVEAVGCFIEKMSW